MPTDFYNEPNPWRRPTWKTMNRSNRKAFHRENELRRLRGQPMLAKP